MPVVDDTKNVTHGPIACNLKGLFAFRFEIWNDAVKIVRQLALTGKNIGIVLRQFEFVHVAIAADNRQLRQLRFYIVNPLLIHQYRR